MFASSGNSYGLGTSGWPCETAHLKGLCREQKFIAEINCLH